LSLQLSKTVGAADDGDSMCAYCAHIYIYVCVHVCACVRACVNVSVYYTFVTLLGTCIACNYGVGSILVAMLPLEASRLKEARYKVADGTQTHQTGCNQAGPVDFLGLTTVFVHRTNLAITIPL
jgi:hypothetical protein